ncbi:MAG: ABC transporter ATP-binding protein/permease [Anaerolineae bacterium]|nr:ABC transporter ATP-binding protein/permease [Anaerolineae bacterium]MCO5199129.1 ABC transporter ATP-binding protein/permease [Anaerolineae bacterium]
MLKSFSRLFIIYKGYRLKLIFSQVLLFISALCMIGVATLTQRLINEGIAQNDIEVVLQTGIWMALLAVIAGITMAGTAAYAVFFSQGTAYIIRARLYEKIQEFSFSNFDRYRTSNLLVRLNADVNNIMNAVMYSVMLLLYAPFMVLIAFTLALINTPNLVWIMIVVTVIVLSIMAILVPRIFNAYDERQKRLDDVNNTLQENLSGVRVVKAFVREELEVERFRTRADAMRKPAFRAAFSVAFFSPMLSGISQLAIATSILIGGTQVLEGTGLNIGELISFTQYLNMVIMPLALMAVVVPFLLRGDTSAGRIFEVYDGVADILDKPEARVLTPEEIKGKIVFDNVTFAFRRPDGKLDPPALKNINLTIEPGESIGILGATGSGKSAMVNLIPRFYDVTEGTITIDGVDVRDIQQESLRRIVGVGLQEAVLFQGDIRFNLKFGAPDVDDEVMRNAAKAADSYGFVSNLPEKWEAPVARRGYNFSGGQRQRLSMNRTLTTRPRILILDDSTSALDVATESRVQDAIPRFAPDLTTIYVAQRISAVLNLDKIILLQNGEIVGVGNHEELITNNALYQEIYESQLGGGVIAGIEEEVTA